MVFISKMKSLSLSTSFLIGFVFAISASTKLFSIDYFEQFIYSFEILNLKLAIVLARLIIAVEYIIALGYFFRLFIKPLSLFTFILLITFTILLFYFEITNTVDDCHCFGAYLQLTNIQSIIKNILLLLLIIWNRNAPNTTKSISLKSTLIILFSITLSFSIHFPDVLIGRKIKHDFCTPCLTNFLKQEKLTDKKLVIFFLSNKCKYCQLAAKKISVIAKKTKSNEQFLYVLWDSNHNAQLFFDETKTIPLHSIELEMLHFLELTKGQMPLILLYNKGKIEHTYRYKDINEQEIKDFINNK